MLKCFGCGDEYFDEDLILINQEHLCYSCANHLRKLEINKIYNMDCLNRMKLIKSDFIDLIVTDVPYGISFMGKEWDIDVPSIEICKQMCRILKHGAFAFILMSPRQDVLNKMIYNLHKGGFETNFTSIYWAYGCLSEDTEILTPDGWELLHKTKRYINKPILVYDYENDEYWFESPSAWHSYKIQEDMFRIKSEDTDQLVTRNHKVFTKEGFKFAENLKEQDEMVFLSSLPSDIWNISSRDTKKTINSRNVLFNKLSPKSQYQKISSKEQKVYSQNDRREKADSKGADDGKEELGLERRGNLFQDTWQLQGSKVHPMSKRVYSDGEKGWLCNGTSDFCSTADMQEFIKNRSSASFRPQSNEQFFEQSGLVCIQQRPQIARTWKSYKTTLATISRVFYEGFVYCPTTSTGVFVARRNKKIFLTGNSGFPKAMNISKKVDDFLGVERNKIEPTGSMHKYKQVYGDYSGQQDSDNPITQQAKSLDGSYAGFQPKPAVEIIIVAMKPLNQENYVKQAMYNQKGIAWFDDCRIPFENNEEINSEACPSLRHSEAEEKSIFGINANKIKPEDYEKGKLTFKGDGTGQNYFAQYLVDKRGRFPANLLVSDDVLNDGNVTKGLYRPNLIGKDYGETQFVEHKYKSSKFKENTALYDDEGSFSRYFSLDSWWQERIKKLPDEVKKVFPFLIVPKASSNEKHESLLAFEPNQNDNHFQKGQLNGVQKPIKNFHPTVKPLDLMSYLVTLGSRENNLIVDPFIGSGTTAIACRLLNRNFIGFEINKEYYNISIARLSEYQKQKKLFEVI